MRFEKGSCIVCGQGTDTALAFHGEAEWHMAALIVLGVPAAEVEQTYRSATGSDTGKVPAGEFTVYPCTGWGRLSLVQRPIV